MGDDGLAVLRDADRVPAAADHRAIRVAFDDAADGRDDVAGGRQRRRPFQHQPACRNDPVGKTPVDRSDQELHCRTRGNCTGLVVADRAGEGRVEQRHGRDCRQFHPLFGDRGARQRLAIDHQHEGFQPKDKGDRVADADGGEVGDGRDLDACDPDRAFLVAGERRLNDADALVVPDELRAVYHRLQTGVVEDGPGGCQPLGNRIDVGHVVPERQTGRDLLGEPVRGPHRFPAAAEIGVRNDVASLRLRDVTPGG